MSLLSVGEADGFWAQLNCRSAPAASSTDIGGSRLGLARVTGRPFSLHIPDTCRPSRRIAKVGAAAGCELETADDFDDEDRALHVSGNAALAATGDYHPDLVEVAHGIGGEIEFPSPTQSAHATYDFVNPILDATREEGLGS